MAENSVKAAKSKTCYNSNGKTISTSKKQQIEQKILAYFKQLTEGCGNEECRNSFCKSSRHFLFKEMSASSLGLEAVNLAKRSATLCLHADSASNCESSQINEDEELMQVSEDAFDSNSEYLGPSGLGSETDDFVLECNDFDEANLRRLANSSDKRQLVRLLSSVFSDPVKLLKVFHIKRYASSNTVATYQTDINLDGDCVDFEEKYESEKSEKSQVEKSRQFLVTDNDFNLGNVDLHLVQHLTRLIPYEIYIMHPLCGSINYLCKQIFMDIPHQRNDQLLAVIVILFEFSVIFDPNYFESVLPSVCMATASMPIVHQAQLCRFWSKTKSAEDLSMIHITLMQLLTLRCFVYDESTNEKYINEDEVIPNVCRVLKLVFYTSLLMGSVTSPEVLLREKGEHTLFLESMNQYYIEVNYLERKRDRSLYKNDPLGDLLGIKMVDCRTPVIPFSEFINDILNQYVSIDGDYQFFQQAEKSELRLGHLPPFSFLNHSFLLNTMTKSVALYFDSRIRMMHERRDAFLQALFTDAQPNLYMKLSIRRSHLIQDALLALEMVGYESPADLKKQLVVEFVGEQGVDEGGLSKEFFQLVVEELFNPVYGMFCAVENTNNMWFNPTSFENDREFVLIGMIFGLAIYNNVILDVYFPRILYRKLMGKLGTFDDLKESHPDLSQGLQNLLSYEHDDVEDVFCYNFCINYRDVFGSNVTFELKPNGASVPVSYENRQEFVDLYSDYLLNKMVQKQFSAFRKGFHLVIDESPLMFLFLPEEIELLVCGSKDYNFHELQESTDYDGGYDADSDIIQFFWKAVHEMTDKERLKLLEFVTGSDRVPLGGMKKLKLVIARQGPDSDRLPTAHTCFNVLLLPEYPTYVKLKDRLMTAIRYSKGFGIL